MEFITTDIQQKKIAQTDHPIHDLLAERWSPRMFSQEPVDRNALETILEAARWAASASNMQPWRFIYAFRGSPGYENIFNCLSDFNQKWVRNAPVLILTAYKEKRSDGNENFHALHDLGLAVGNLTLQAQSMGVAVHQMAGVRWKEAQRVFEVPEGYHITTAIALGYYGGDPSELPQDLENTEREPRKRIPRETFAWEGQWEHSAENSGA